MLVYAVPHLHPLPEDKRSIGRLLSNVQMRRESTFKVVNCSQGIGRNSETCDLSTLGVLLAIPREYVHLLSAATLSPLPMISVALGERKPHCVKFQIIGL